MPWTLDGARVNGGAGKKLVGAWRPNDSDWAGPSHHGLGA
jgi:hypothetical protein